LYAVDLAGNAANPKTVYFNVDSPTFPVIPLITVAAVVMSLGLGLLFYFKKRVSQESLTKKQVL
jgi:hypothetical protein